MKNKPIHTNPAKGRLFSLSYDVTYTFHQVLFLLSSSAPFQPKKRQQTLMLHPPPGKEQSCMEPQKKINEKKLFTASNTKQVQYTFNVLTGFPDAFSTALTISRTE